MTTIANPIKILVVDDKKVIQDFFDFTLGFYGHQITVVQDPSLVIGLVKEKSFDIVFLDMVMPDMDGLECLKKIKKNHPETIVIILSGLQDERIAKEAIRYGAYDYLTKPFDLNYLKENILGRIF